MILPNKLVKRDFHIQFQHLDANSDVELVQVNKHAA